MTDVAQFITINRDFIKNRFQDKTTVKLIWKLLQHKTKKLLREEKKY